MTKYIKLYKFIISTLLLLFTTSLFAQDLSKLSPDQLEMYNKYKASQGTSTQTATPTVKATVTERTINEKDSNIIFPSKIVNDSKTLQVYGSYLFNKERLSFEPKLNIPTPADYVLGTYDEIIIDVSGLYEANYKLKVSPDGYIRIPNVGPIRVAGQTIASASKAIRSQVSKVFTGISSGKTSVNISLGDIRSIRVAVVGEAVRPGSYTLPSLATAFNALYACGGPNETGTMRDIKVVRAGKVIAHLDVYKYLSDGTLLNNVVLQDEDVIRIDPYELRTKITGAVKRIGIYEGKKGESLQNLLQYAGGFTDNAYKGKITIFRYSQKLKSVIDVEQAQYSTFKITSGDSLFIATTVDQYENKIDLVGAVYQPGSYALERGLTVKQLIAKAGGVKADAFMKLAFIKRKQANLLPENHGFNLGELLADDLKDIPLQRDDTVEIKSLFDYHEKQQVTISGPVKNPGVYELKANTKLKELIFMAGGLLEKASTDSLELVRMIKDPKILFSTNEKSTVQKLAMDSDFNLLDGGDSISLQNGDQLIIRTIYGYEEIRMVRVEGEVIYPGSYNIKNKLERVSDVLKRSGGFTNYAYPTGAFLIRNEKSDEIQDKINNIIQNNSKSQFASETNKSINVSLLKKAGTTDIESINSMDSLQNELSGGNIINNIFEKEGIVGINLEEIMHNPGCKYDLKLEDGDIIFVPRELQTVKVVGQVLFPTLVRFDKGMSLKNYINNSGGFAENANKKKVFVLYANGSAKSTKNFLGMRCYPKIYPGARIIIPEKPIEIKNPLSAGETIGILTSITSVAALVYTIIK